MTITIPDGMPVLSQGMHVDPKDGACLMEYISMLAGAPFSDQPACTDFMLTLCAQTVNDLVGHKSSETDALRAKYLLPLVPRLMGTNTAPRKVIEEVAQDLRCRYLAESDDLPYMGGTDRMMASTLSMWVYVAIELDRRSTTALGRAAAGREILEFVIDRYEVHMGDIGEPVRRIEVVPVPEPNEAPVQEPSPQIAPVREPVPA